MPEMNFSNDEFVRAALFDIALNLRVLVKATQFGRPLTLEEISQTGPELNESITTIIKGLKK